MPTPSKDLLYLRFHTQWGYHTTVNLPLPNSPTLKILSVSLPFLLLPPRLPINIKIINCTTIQEVITCSGMFRGNLPLSTFYLLKTWNQSNLFPYLPPSSLDHQCITTRCILTSFKLLTYYSTKWSIWDAYSGNYYYSISFSDCWSYSVCTPTPSKNLSPY